MFIKLKFLIGIIKYDDKHDSYFIQATDKSVHTLFGFNQDLVSQWLGDTVCFESNEANEVMTIEGNRDSEVR